MIKRIIKTKPARLKVSIRIILIKSHRLLNAFFEKVFIIETTALLTFKSFFIISTQRAPIIKFIAITPSLYDKNAFHTPEKLNIY